jgi:hypothetical protein
MRPAESEACALAATPSVPVATTLLPLALSARRSTAPLFPIAYRPTLPQSPPHI